jgi:hypothetical protein
MAKKEPERIADSDSEAVKKWVGGLSTYLERVEVVYE